VFMSKEGGGEGGKECLGGCMWMPLLLCARVNLTLFQSSCVGACVVYTSTHKRTHAHAHAHVCVCVCICVVNLTLFQFSCVGACVVYT